VEKVGKGKGEVKGSINFMNAQSAGGAGEGGNARDIRSKTERALQKPNGGVREKGKLRKERRGKGWFGIKLVPSG